MKKSKISNALNCYLWITIGSVIYAIGFDWLYVPNGIGFGGITSLGQILNYYVPALPIGMVVLVANIPLFLLGWRLLGGHLLISSLYAMAATSVLVDLFAYLFTFPPMDDLIARLLKIPFSWLPVGKLLLAVDLIMIVLVAFAFRSMDSALYGIIALYISSIAMDGVIYGMDASKVAYIISSEPRKVAAAIDQQLDRGLTYLHGEGGGSGEDKLVLMCAFKQRQIVPMKKLVHEIDPGAFIIVCDAHEVLGEGFRRYQQNSL